MNTPKQSPKKKEVKQKVIKEEVKKVDNKVKNIKVKNTKVENNKVENRVKRLSIKELPHEEKDKRIEELLSIYNVLVKKGNKEGRQIRRKLRRLGYFLSKLDIDSKDIVKTEE